MGSKKTMIAAAVTATLAITAAASGAQAQDENWAFEISPYLWAVGIDADIAVGNHTVAVDVGFDDILEALDIGGGLLAGARFNHFLVLTQIDYLSVDSDELDDAPARGRAEVESFMAMLALGYRFGGDDVPGKHFDVLLGARNATLKTTLTLDALGVFERERDYVDPIVMLQPSWPLGKRWRFMLNASYGTGGDSEETWEVQPQFQWQISDHWAARFGYRLLDYDIEVENGNGFDGAFEGPIIGIGGTFGGTSGRMMREAAKPAPAPAPVVASAPPPPPPAPPPAPKDTDGDGVVDHIDKCPSTARGEKVDPVGCAYNVQLDVRFETNSATLTQDSSAELDRLVEALNSTPTLSVIVEGHTDSTGSDAYNKSLSQRRAQAVVDYLSSHGVNANRLRCAGSGHRSQWPTTRQRRGVRRIDAS